jgi:hypothetical protein
MMARGEIDYAGFLDLVASSAPSTGFCNTMGTATTMNSLAEALGMQLPGSAAIPAPYRDRGEMAWRTGKRAVEIVHEDLKPSDIMTRAAFINAIRINSAIGGSTNAPKLPDKGRRVMPGCWAAIARSGRRLPVVYHIAVTTTAKCSFIRQDAFSAPTVAPPAPQPSAAVPAWRPKGA